MGSCIRLNEGVDIQMDVHMDDFVRAKISCMHRFLLPYSPVRALHLQKLR